MKPIFAIAFVFVAYLFAGTMDYRIAKGVEQESAAKTAIHEARIWSKRCEKQGKQTIAKQSDGGKWTVHCVKANLEIKA